MDHGLLTDFLSVKLWQPNFVASTAKETYSTIWLRLPELPVQYYDHKILVTIGNKMDRLVKTDICTLSTLRGRYTRICVEVHIGISVKQFINIDNLKQG